MAMARSRATTRRQAQRRRNNASVASDGANSAPEIGRDGVCSTVQSIDAGVQGKDSPARPVSKA
jgi:hypothetical protein